MLPPRTPAGLDAESDGVRLPAPKEREPAANARRGFVFISFKTEERVVARQMKEALERYRFKVWWQEAIQCGQEWHGTIDQAVRDSGCIIVLWSKRAMASQWVKHEASQAIARGIYAPVRIELLEIEPPFNRLQATDLVGWNGDTQAPGFFSLLARINHLLPAPLSLGRRLSNWLSRARNTLFATVVAIAAMLVLAFLVRAVTGLVGRLDHLTESQERSAKDVERALHPIENLNVRVWVVVSPGASRALDAYAQRLTKALSNVSASTPLPSGAYVSQSGPDRRPMRVAFSVNSPLWPSQSNEEEAFFAFRYLDLSMSFYPLSAAAAESAEGSLTISCGTGDSKLSPEVELDLDAKLLRVFFTSRPEPSEWRRKDGEMMSVNDLAHSIVRLELRSIMMPRGAQNNSSGLDEDAVHRMQLARSALRLDTLLMNVGAREFWLRATALKETTGPNGLRRYVGEVKEGDPAKVGAAR